MQGKYVLGKIDPEKHNREGHRLGQGYPLKNRIPVLALHRTDRFGSNLGGSARLGGATFVRQTSKHIGGTPA